MWVTDGTPEGTAMIMSVLYSRPQILTAYNGKLYLRFRDGTHGLEPWVSDGTLEGTVMLKDISQARGDSGGSFPEHFTGCNGKVYFEASDEVHGNEPWITDGTSEGTEMIKDICLGERGSYSEYFTEYNGKLYFRSSDAPNNFELWTISLCGDGIIEPGEECEKDSDCDVNYDCDGCMCFFIDSDNDEITDDEDNCPYVSNPNQADLDEDEIGDVCDEDLDGDEISNDNDNCLIVYNADQNDTYPPQSNGIGDLCDCESDFDCDGDVDGSDATTFKLYFGRNPMFYPCDEINPCRGDFDCDGDSDGTDAGLYKEDFGRNEFNNPCPTCVVEEWCSY
jgi:ELWxxDGT repeat protein